MESDGYLLPDFAPGPESRDGYEARSAAGGDGVRAVGEDGRPTVIYDEPAELGLFPQNGVRGGGGGDCVFGAGDDGLRDVCETGGVVRQLEVELHHVGEGPASDRGSVGTRSEADSEESELTLDPAAIPNVSIASDRRGNNI